MELTDRGIKRGQELQPLGGDAGRVDTAILYTSLALNQAPALEPVEKARDVGIVREHALADFAAAEPGIARAAQDTKEVVLSVRKSGGT